MNSKQPIPKISAPAKSEYLAPKRSSAIPGCVYLASKGFSAKSLATAIGFTQCLGMLGGSAGQFVVGPLIEKGIDISAFWLYIGIFTIIVAFGLWFITPANNSTKTRPEITDRKSVV